MNKAGRSSAAEAPGVSRKKTKEGGVWLSGLLAARRRPRQRPRRPGAPAAGCRGPSGGHGVCVCVCVRVRPRSSRDFPSAPVPVLTPQRPFWSQTRRHSSLWLHSPAPGLLCAASAKGSWYENEARVPSGRKNAFHTHTRTRTHALIHSVVQVATCWEVNFSPLSFGHCFQWTRLRGSVSSQRPGERLSGPPGLCAPEPQPGLSLPSPPAGALVAGLGAPSSARAERQCGASLRPRPGPCPRCHGPFSDSGPLVSL